MTQHEIDSVLTDVRYAMRQLREFGEVQRALDALDRVESALTFAAAEARGLEIGTPEAVRFTSTDRP